MVELIKLLKSLLGGKLTFIACRRQDGEEDRLVLSKRMIPSISFFGVWINQVLEELE